MVSDTPDYSTIRDEAFTSLALRQFGRPAFAKNLIEKLHRDGMMHPEFVDDIIPAEDPPPIAGNVHYSSPSEDNFASTQEAENTADALHVHITCPSGRERDFTLIHILRDPETGEPEHKPTGAKIMAFKEDATDEVHVILAGSRASRNDNWIVFQAVINDDINLQAQANVVPKFFDELFEIIEPETPIHIAGVSLGAQNAVLALAYTNERGREVDLALYEPFNPALMLNKVATELAEKKGTSAEEENQQLWEKMRDVRVTPATIVGAWPWETTPWHAMRIGEEQFDLHVKERGYGGRDIYNWLYGHHESTGVMDLAGPLHAKLSEAIEPSRAADVVDPDITSRKSLPFNLISTALLSIMKSAWGQIEEGLADIGKNPNAYFPSGPMGGNYAARIEESAKEKTEWRR